MPNNDKNFVDFVIDARTNEKLLEGFLAPDSPEALQDFFVNEGYGGITMNDCTNLIDTRKDFTIKEEGWLKSY